MITAVKDVLDMLMTVVQSEENFKFDSFKFYVGFNDVDEELPLKLFGLYDFLTITK
jgi:hypothetical protein